MLSVFGGKITTYRKLAEAALAELKPFFPQMKPAWTRDAVLPGGDLPARRPRGLARGTRARATRACRATLLRALAHRHGTRATSVLGDARTNADLGEDFGADLTAREIDYLRSDEWALTRDDILWRRTKCGLSMTAEQAERVAESIGG